MKLIFSRVHRPKGQLATVLNLFLAVFLVLVIGLFAFELSRYFLARDELKTNVEAAALCCETALVSTGNPNDAANQTTAMNAALQLFQQNSILGRTMGQAILVTSTAGVAPAFDVQPGQAQICFQFLDPLTHKAVNTSGGATSGTLIQATGAYSYSPAFGQMIGISNMQFTFSVSALSGVPKLDVIIAYDISGSEDFETPVTFVQRYWDQYGTEYLVPGTQSTGSSTTGGPIGPGTTCTDYPPPPSAIRPQSLENIINCPSPPIKYAEQGGYATKQLTGSATSPTTPSAGCAPPGNYVPNSSSSSTGSYTGSTTVLPEEWRQEQIKVAQSKSKSNQRPIVINGHRQVISYHNEDLWQTCARIDAGHKKNKLSLGPLDDRLSKIAFAPQFSVQQVVINNPQDTEESGGASGVPTVTPYGATVTATDNSVANYTFGGGSCIPPSSSSSTGFGASTPVGVSANPNTVASAAASSSYGSYYTDIVVNIGTDQTQTTPTTAYPGGRYVYNAATGVSYAFPSLGSLVEAMRGNLENSSNVSQSGTNLTALGLANVQSGYYAAYVAAAKLALEPMCAIYNSVIGFMNELATVSDVHFGLITFNDYACDPTTCTTCSQYMAPPSGVAAPYIMSGQFPYSAMGPNGTFVTTSQFLVPSVSLDPTGNTTQQTIINLFENLDVWGNRNCAAAIQAAVNELTANNSGATTFARPGANRAIVLVTAGPPTVDLADNSGATALSDAITQAQLANTAGIPIYCVSVAQTSSDDTNEDAAYGDGSNGTSASGIAATAGYGSKYYRVDWDGNPTDCQNALTSVFANIARILVSIVH